MGKNRNKGRKKNKQKKRKVQEVEAGTPEIRYVKSLRLMPEIIGGEFSEFHNDIEELQREIDKFVSERKGKEPQDYKRRILFSTEASYLHTGFSTYLREIMRRLHSTGKFELAELGSYGHTPELDARAGKIPWKYYHSMPCNSVEEEEYKKDYKENQFGKWKLS